MHVYFVLPSGIKFIPSMEAPAFTGPRIGSKFSCVNDLNNTVHCTVSEVIYETESTRHGTHLKCQVVLVR